MSEYIINITEEETIQCQVCNEVFNTNEITTDDDYSAQQSTSTMLSHAK